MGIIVQGKGLWRALFTRTQRRVLGLLYGYPERSFYANEIVRLAGVGTGAVQRELNKLSEAGLFTIQRVGNQKHYQANPDCPFYAELRSIVLKTFGSLDLLRTTLRGLDEQIDAAFIYGDGIREPVSAGAVLNLVVISRKLKRTDAQRRLRAAARQLDRKLEWVLLSPERWQKLRKDKNPQLQEVLDQPRLMLIGQLPGEDA